MRPGKRKKLKWAGLGCTGTIIAVVLVLLTSEQHLVVYRWETVDPLFKVQVRSGTEFSLWFLHSYDRAFFQEHYRLEKGGRIVLTRMSFKSCLNGQGFEEGVYRTKPDGTAELCGIDRQIPEIRFRLGSPDLANHTLIIGSRRIPLLNYAEAGEIIGIRPVARLRWQSLLENGARYFPSLKRELFSDQHAAMRRAGPTAQEFT